MTDPKLVELLIVGLDDWLDAAWLVSALCVEEDAVAPPELTATKATVIDAVRSLLEGGLVEIGDLVEPPGGRLVFAAWAVEPDHAIARIAREWEELGGLPGHVDLFWLRNTPAGDAIARAALAERTSGRS